MESSKQLKVKACQSAITSLRNKDFNHPAALIMINNIKLRVQNGDFSWEELETSAVELNILLNLLKVKQKIA